MSLNPGYMIAPSMEEFFIDKTVGLPLAGGNVYFYSDINRSFLKNIYTLSGSPPNYSYVILPNPCVLSAVGTFQDGSGNNVLPYYYPYDPDGNVENYYIEVYDANGNLQFVREAFPNIGSQGGNVESVNAINYIPNGQFRLHNNISAGIGIQAGQITQSNTIIAPGGWSFQRSAGSTAADFVTFFQYGEYLNNPSASPQFACQIVCTSADPTTTNKGLYIIWPDVNKFTSNLNQTYTFSFSGITFSSGGFPITLNLVKFFGTGGTPSNTQITALTTFNITNVQTTFQFSFTFGTNDGTDIGTNNDSYVALQLSLPTNITFGCQVTDFLMVSGTVDIASFPQTTDADFSARSLTLLPPAFDGSQLGLPIIVTQSGLGVDTSIVGRIDASIQNSMTYGFLCNGNQYLTSGYQSSGIPNSRLQKVLWNTNSLLPCYGTGLTFSTTQIDSSVNTNIIRIHPNTAGPVAATADGSVATGFSFSNMAVGYTGYGIYAPVGSGFFILWNNTFGSAISAVGTSGFIQSIIKAGDSQTAQIFQYTTTDASALAGKYLTYSTPSSIPFYIWFKVSGSGSDPAPGGFGILVNLLSGDSAQTVANKIGNVLNGYECDYITCNAGSSITSGSYWTFNNIGGAQTNWYVWYQVNGIGTDPIPSGLTGILVQILSTDTASQVCTKTVTAINSYYYAVPDLRGQFLRAIDPINKYDAGPRYSFVDGIYGNIPGTFELGTNLSHYHNYNMAATPLLQSGSNTNCFTMNINSNTSSTGGQENRPYNAAINFFIHY